MIASWWQLASEHFLSFTGGVLVGFGLTSRYRLIRRSGEKGDA